MGSHVVLRARGSRIYQDTVIEQVNVKDGTDQQLALGKRIIFGTVT